MPDLADLASERIEREETAFLTQHAHRPQGPAPVYVGGVPTCAVCGDTLPAARADAGRGRCVWCQEHHEHMGRLRP